MNSRALRVAVACVECGYRDWLIGTSTPERLAHKVQTHPLPPTTWELVSDEITM